MFHLERPDVLAPEDLGLRLGVADAYGVAPEAAASFMVEKGPAWSPYNTVAARVLWPSRRKTMGGKAAQGTGQRVRLKRMAPHAAQVRSASKQSSRNPASRP